MSGVVIGGWDDEEGEGQVQHCLQFMNSGYCSSCLFLVDDSVTYQSRIVLYLMINICSKIFFIILHGTHMAT